VTCAFAQQGAYWTAPLHYAPRVLLVSTKIQRMLHNANHVVIIEQLMSEEQ
jgi:hypothetical protein